MPSVGTPSTSSQVKKEDTKVDLPPSGDPLGLLISGAKGLGRNDLDLKIERAIQANEFKPRILQELYDDLRLRMIDIAAQPLSATNPSDVRIGPQDYATLMHRIEYLIEDKLTMQRQWNSLTKQLDSQQVHVI